MQNRGSKKKFSRKKILPGRRCWWTFHILRLPFLVLHADQDERCIWLCKSIWHSNIVIFSHWRFKGFLACMKSKGRNVLRLHWIPADENRCVVRRFDSPTHTHLSPSDAWERKKVWFAIVASIEKESERTFNQKVILQMSSTDEIDFSESSIAESKFPIKLGLRNSKRVLPQPIAWQIELSLQKKVETEELWPFLRFEF